MSLTQPSEPLGFVHPSSEVRAALDGDICVYCKSPLTMIDGGGATNAPKDIPYENDFIPFDRGWVEICARCGWWRTSRLAISGALTWATDFGAFGVLKDLDVSDISMPLTAIRTFLQAKYESRFEMHPRLLETTVAAVMNDLGFTAQATAYSGDGGIDVVLTDAHGRQVGIQVKRYRNKVKVEHIRSLLGALVLKGMTAGIFVTTSEFQPGAVEAANRSSARGVPIELVDARRFLDALQITARPMYAGFDEWMACAGDFALVACERRLV
jgi:restriction system protein